MLIDEDQLAQLYDLDEEEFVDEVYHLLLKREADSDGKNSYLKRLHEGTSRAAIIFDCRLSEEGKSQDTKIQGLRLQKIDINQLLILSNETFTQAAFLAITGTNADEQEINATLDKLNNKKVSKIQIIKQLQQTPGGIQNHLQISGLHAPFHKSDWQKKLKNQPRLQRFARRLYHTLPSKSSSRNKKLNKQALTEKIEQLEKEIATLKKQIQKLQKYSKGYYLEDMSPAVRVTFALLDHESTP